MKHKINKAIETIIEIYKITIGLLLILIGVSLPILLGAFVHPLFFLCYIISPILMGIGFYLIN